MSGSGGFSTPPLNKTKEKKRVGFSEGHKSPLRDDVSRPGSSGGGLDPDDAELSSHDGVDHNELTRALSRILQREGRSSDLGAGPTAAAIPTTTVTAASASSPRSSGRGSGRNSVATSPLAGPSMISTGNSSTATQYGQQSSPLAQPQPSYFPPMPPARQQQHEMSEKAAKERADRLAESVERDYSTPASRRGSADAGMENEDVATAAAISASYERERGRRRAHDPLTSNSASPTDNEEDLHLDLPHKTAVNLVRSHTRARNVKPLAFADAGSRDSGFHYDASLVNPGGRRSGTSTPTTAVYEADGHVYVPPPAKYHGGVLASLLRLYNNTANGTGTNGMNSEQSTPGSTPMSSRPPSPSRGDNGGGGSGGADTPSKRLSGFFALKNGKLQQAQQSQQQQNQQQKQNQQHLQPQPPSEGKPWVPWHPHHRSTSSTTSLSAGLLGSTTVLASTGSADIGQAVTERLKRERPPLKRSRTSANSIFGGNGKSSKNGEGKSGRKRREDEQIRITIHIAHVLSRHRYLTTLCRALMLFGAPTHRLEDYLKMSSRVLEIEAQFLYVPGCMLVSFDDSSTHTAEVKLVRAPQGVDLGKLRDVHTIYKEVVHDLISVDEATTRLNGVLRRKDKFKVWLRVLVYGLASVSVAPFAFQGRFIDLPIAFVLGCIVGLLALVAAPSNVMYQNVFEISAAVVTSFLSRAAGSIHGGDLFCFSALAQSSIALILPGYMVLCSSLELQSQNIVAGSVRMVYAMIYTLFLGYGITIGTAVYGAIDSGATSETACRNPLSRPWYFLFVPLFTICLCIINQAKWKQIPIMVLISVAGFSVSTYASSYFSNNAQIPSTLGALTVGVTANLYARLSRYFERFFLKLWAKHLEPWVDWAKKRKNRFRGKWPRKWHILGSRNSSRRGSATDINDSNEYLDMPPYHKDPPAAAEEGHGDAVVAEAAAADAAAAEAERKAPGSSEVMGYGLAAAAMLPAIFVQVPSGLAVNGSLLSGLTAANDLVGNSTTRSSSSSSSTTGVDTVAFSVLMSVVQVSIGITVGLFFSALLVYPFGKRRSALFSF